MCNDDNPDHVKQLQELGIEYIDLGLCEFVSILKKPCKNEGVTHEEIIENIDIGGPSMLQ